jgi:23S rRNA pseudouridine2605 synthase
VPLVRALSKLGLVSRTDARALILAGRVRVNGRVVTDGRTGVIPERVRIAIDGRETSAPARRIIVLHKPRGVVTTRRDPEKRRTVFDVLGAAGEGLAPVGRLDMASTGLLLFTNDTRLASRLTDPATGLRRRYVVIVRGSVSAADARRLESGLDVVAPDGAGERLRAASVLVRKSSNRETHLIVDLLEGRNREIRRLFEAIGHAVTRLHRVAFGAIALGTLAPGAWRELTGTERQALGLVD